MKSEQNLLMFTTGESVLLSQVVAIFGPHDGGPDFFTGVEVVLKDAGRCRIPCGTFVAAQRTCEEASKLWLEYMQAEARKTHED